MLRIAGGARFEVVHHRRLAEACRDLTANGAACVLLDLSLPDAEGLEAVTRTQATAPDVPIVVLSGHDDESLALAAVQEGAQDYLMKGSDAMLVSRSIRYAIERKRVEVQLNHQALHDPLTNLPNRNVFLDRLTHALARSLRRETGVAVLLLDLDRFKVINDSLGHDTGDRLLVDVARRLVDVLRPGDTVARFGGDEFTILCEDLADERDVVIIAERVIEALGQPFWLDECDAHLSVSIGIAIADAPGHLPEDLIRDADAAMYRSKQRGPARYEIFDEVMRGRALERLEVENALHRALEREELKVFYQPIVDLDTGLVTAAEALLRWDHPERGLIEPTAFITVAEETGLIIRIGGWVIERALRQAMAWRDACPEGEAPAVHVNLSAGQLQQPALIELVAQALTQTGLPPRSVCFEVTESAMLEEESGAISTVRALKDLGVRVAIDDFGTGYASLAMLKRVPVDVVKIDQSFVSGLEGEATDLAIVTAVTGLADSLGLQTIAEGVESLEQFHALRVVGCHTGQGFLFASGMSAEELRRLLVGGLRLPHGISSAFTSVIRRPRQIH